MKLNYYLILAFLLIMPLQVSAFDKNDYKEYADQMRSQVWEQSQEEFQNPKTTDRFSQHSAVILAAYEEFVVTKKNKLSFWSTSGVAQELHCYSLYRQQVQLNDRAALERYSEYDFLAFTKRRSAFNGTVEMRNVLGVRIIKPDGTVHEVSTDDYVVMAEGNKNKDERQKLAVPGLEVGDIIDVFTSTYFRAKDIDPKPQMFFFINEYPMLSYRVHCEIDPDLAIQYRPLNGAPAFRQNYNLADVACVLNAKAENIEQTVPSLWYVSAEQSPVILLNVHFTLNSGKSNYRQPGLQANPDATLLQQDDWQAWDNRKHFTALSRRQKDAVNDAVVQFDDLEQRADYIYEYLEACELSNLLNTTSSAVFITILRLCFDKAGIQYQCGMTTDEHREPLDQLISPDNTTWFLRLPSGKCYFTPHFACRPGEVPNVLQDRKALVCIHPKQKLLKGPYQPIMTPKAEAADNQDVYVLNVDIDMERTSLNIQRRRTITGNFRENLSLFLPTRNELVTSILKNNHPQKTHASLYDKKYESIVKEQDAKDLETRDEKMRLEVFVYHEREPLEMLEAKMLTMGTTDEEPALSYEVNYSIDGLVKRAGQNLIVSVGKLMSQPYRIEGKDRERTADIVREMPYVTSYDITLRLPEGYTVTDEALASLRLRVENAVGSFVVEPSLEIGQLHLKVTKTMLHKREPVANWQQILDIYDADGNFNEQQIVISRMQ